MAEGEREREMKGGREAIVSLSLKRILLADKPAMEYFRKHHILGFRFIQVYSGWVGVERFGCFLEIPSRCSAIAFIRKHHMHPAHISFLSSFFFSQAVGKMKV
jgi:hypothetical protein